MKLKFFLLLINLFYFFTFTDSKKCKKIFFFIKILVLKKSQNLKNKSEKSCLGGQCNPYHTGPPVWRTVQYVTPQSVTYSKNIIFITSDSKYGSEKKYFGSEKAYTEKPMPEANVA